MSEIPRLEVTSVTLGAPDPRALADFYVRLIGGSVVATDPPRPGQPPQDGWAQVKPPAGRLGLTLNFEYEPEYTAPTWPSEPGKQQIMEHLDIWVDDLAQATAWAVGVGARLADYQPQEDVRVLLDPAGHPFCLFS
ncbi:VOC family protein [soil metagenome]